MATVFLYARLWRRSGVLTDLEFTGAQIPPQQVPFYDGCEPILDTDPGYFGDWHHTTRDDMSIIDKNTLKAVGQTAATCNRAGYHDKNRTPFRKGPPGRKSRVSHGSRAPIGPQPAAKAENPHLSEIHSRPDPGHSGGHHHHHGDKAPVSGTEQCPIGHMLGSAVAADSGIVVEVHAVAPRPEAKVTSVPAPPRITAYRSRAPPA